MTVYHILEFVNNFMQIFEPRDNTQAQVLDMRLKCLLRRTSLFIAWPFWSSFLRSVFVSSIYGICKAFLTFVCSQITVTNYKLSKQPDFAE